MIRANCDKKGMFFQYFQDTSSKPTEVLLDGDLTIKKFAKKIGTSAGGLFMLQLLALNFNIVFHDEI